MGGINSGGSLQKGMTQKQLDTLNALVQLVNTKANQQYVIDQIAAVVGAAPAALDTLAEIAAQLGNDGSAITALTNAVANAVRFDAAQSLTTPQKTQVLDNLGVAAAGRTGSYTDLSNKPTIPTNTNQLTNGAGFITSAIDKVLTGLSVATATAVTATDTILTAIGKLQAQAANNAALLPPFFDTAWYRSGLYYDAVYPYYTTIAPTTGSVGTLYLCKRKILNDVTFSELSVNVTAAAASSNVFYGIYASDASGLPSTLLASGSASGATTGVKSTAVTLALTKGQVVWDAYLNTGASVSVTAFQPIFQGGTGSPIANGTVMLTRYSQTSLPADASVGGAFSLMTTTRIPRVALRAA